MHGIVKFFAAIDILISVAVLAFGVMMTSAARAEFKLDMPPAELRKITKVFVISDLATGETGIVNYPQFCLQDGGLRIYGLGRLAAKRNDYATNWIATRQPGGSISMKVEPGLKDSTDVLRGSLLDTLVALRSCEFARIDPGELLPIAEINGRTSVSEIVTTGVGP